MMAAVLWTGGKDSCLALHRVIDQGVSIACLATFVPADGQDFKAHPRQLMEKQARSLGLPHFFLEVKEPYEEGYEEGLAFLRDRRTIGAVVTGDIDAVAGHSNWIRERCRGLDIEVIRPLWKEPRISLMKELLSRRIEAQITWINHPEIPQSWKGCIIDEWLLAELVTLAERTEIDLCGENGEYHTMVIRAPMFRAGMPIV
jgi:diphthine-ammonia ligase